MLGVEGSSRKAHTVVASDEFISLSGRIIHFFIFNKSPCITNHLLVIATLLIKQNRRSTTVLYMLNFVLLQVVCPSFGEAAVAP